MVRLTSLGARLLALGFSTAAHAALLAPMGHAGPARGTPEEAVAVDLLTEVTQQPAEPEPEPTPAPHAGHASWPTHTHSYPVPAGHDATPHDPNLVHLPAFPAPHDTPAAAAPAVTADDATPRFDITVGAAPAGAHGIVAPSGTTPAHDDDAPLPAASVDAQARLVRGLAPEYPDDARASGIEGDVGLELVVGLSGAVETARVVRGVGHGLDEAALRAARQFRFAPATRGGRAVRVRMGWSVQFRLR